MNEPITIHHSRLEPGPYNLNQRKAYLQYLRSRGHKIDPITTYKDADYLYNLKVLRWETSSVRFSEEYRHTAADRICPITPLTETYTQQENYFNAFAPLALRETWAMLHQSMEKLPPSSKLTIKKTQIARRSDYPSILELQGRLKVESGGSASGLILLINYRKRFEFFGLTSVEDFDSKTIRVKTIFPEELYEQLKKPKSHKKKRRNPYYYDDHDNGWRDLKGDYVFVYALEAITTLRRIYGVSLISPNVSFISNLLHNDLDWQSIDSSEISYLDSEFSDSIFEESSESSSEISNSCLPLIESNFEHLNDSQRGGIQKIESISEGISLIQGPPGTGKTTTIVSFLRHQVREHKKDIALVTAPSNKAVHVLLRRFKKEAADMPHLRIWLAGTEDKLPDDLRENFVHVWASDITKQLKPIQNALTSFEKIFKTFNSNLVYLNDYSSESEESSTSFEESFTGDDLEEIHDFKSLILPNLELPETFTTSLNNGDGYFFSAFAHALNVAKNTYKYSEESLREACYEYYAGNERKKKKSHKKEVDDLYKNIGEKNQTHRSYERAAQTWITISDYEYVRHDKSSMEFLRSNSYQETPVPDTIFGRIEVEGVILCRELKIPLINFIKLEKDLENGTVSGQHLIVTSKGIEEKDVVYVELFDEHPTLVMDASKQYFFPIFNTIKIEKNLEKGFQNLAEKHKGLAKLIPPILPAVMEKFDRVKIEKFSEEIELRSFKENFENFSAYFKMWLAEDGAYSKHSEEYLALPTMLSEKISIVINKLNFKPLRGPINPDPTVQDFLLQKAHMVFSTLSVAGRGQMRGNLNIHTVVVDEAAQCVEAETLIPLGLQGVKRMVLVGDTNQLPATVISQAAIDLNYDISMMERLEIRNESHLLNCQYRMDPEISIWPSEKYYAGLLENGSNVSERPPLLQDENNPDNPFLLPTHFIHISGREKKEKHSHSLINEAEVQATFDLILYLKKHFKVKKSIGVITFYAAQSEALKKKLNQFKWVRVSTVDGFQGEENDIIIISCVRANKNNSVGFVRDFRRLNVAITRAKYHLYLLGHQETLRNSRTDIAELVINYEERGLILHNEHLTEAMDESPLIKLSGIQNKKSNRKLERVIELLGEKFSPKIFRKAAKDLQNINERHVGRIGDTILMKLIRKSTLESKKAKTKLKILLELGADWYATNNEGENAIDLLQKLHPEKVEQYIVAPDSNQLINKANPKLERLIKLLGEKFSIRTFRRAAKNLENINERHIGKVGDTVLMKLIRKSLLETEKSLKKLRILLALGASWDVENNQGETALNLLEALHPEKVEECFSPPKLPAQNLQANPKLARLIEFLGENFNIEVFREMAESLENINERHIGKIGDTVLMKFIRKSTFESTLSQQKLILLLELGADWHAANNEGENAIDLLQRYHPKSADNIMVCSFSKKIAIESEQSLEETESKISKQFNPQETVAENPLTFWNNEKTNTLHWPTPTEADLEDFMESKLGYIFQNPPL